MGEKSYTVFESIFDEVSELARDEYYVLRLECMVSYAEQGDIRTYCGTLDEIAPLIENLDKDDETREYYASTIAAWEKFLAGEKNALHVVGSKVERLLTPAKELYRASFSLDDARWSYTDQYGCTMLASADIVDVYQVLLCCKYNYLRFAFYRFTNLKQVHSDLGWIDYQARKIGVPGMVCQNKNGETYTWLCILVDTFKTQATGAKALQDDQRIDYERISRELFVR